jgi:hypothetical protein
MPARVGGVYGAMYDDPGLSVSLEGAFIGRELFRVDRGARGAKRGVDLKRVAMMPLLSRGRAQQEEEGQSTTQAF